MNQDRENIFDQNSDELQVVTRRPARKNSAAPEITERKRIIPPPSEVPSASEQEVTEETVGLPDTSLSSEGSAQESSTAAEQDDSASVWIGDTVPVKKNVSPQQIKHIMMLIAALIVIAVIGLLLYKAQYPSLCTKRAYELYEQGEYEEALEVYKKGDEYAENFFSDNPFILDCTYGIAEKLFEAGDYSQCITMLSEIEEERDVTELMCEAKYRYVCEEWDAESASVYYCMGYLQYRDYKDSHDLYNELFGWRADLIANSDENDTKSDLAEFKVGEDIVIHYTLNGGTPNGKYYSTLPGYTLRYTNPDGTTGEIIYKDNQHKGTTGTVSTASGLSSKKAGTLTIEILAETELDGFTVIGTISVRIVP